MTTTTTAELAAVSGTDLTTLPPAARAAVALKSAQTRADLAELVKQSVDITEVLNADGREQAHRVGMTLKGARVAIEKTGKEARDDATKFSKAVIAEEKELIAIIEPEEARILALRDAWDERIAAEKAAKIAAERARVEAIQGRIEAIRRAPLAVVGESSAAILITLELVRDKIIDDSFEEFKDQAMAVRSEAFNALEAAHQKAAEAEAAALAAEEARLAEIARIAAEREELAQLRAAAAETARLAKIETDRIAAEQAAEAKRLSDLAAAQELAASKLREAAEANLQAEREALAERERLADEAQVKAAADLKAAIEAHALEVAAHAAKLRVDIDHAEALPMNAQSDVDREAERVRLQALADQAAADARERANDERKTGLPAGSLHALIDDLDELDPTDEEITAMGAECGLTPGEWVIRLSKYVAAQELVAA